MVNLATVVVPNDTKQNPIVAEERLRYKRAPVSLAMDSSLDP